MQYTSINSVATVLRLKYQVYSTIANCAAPQNIPRIQESRRVNSDVQMYPLLPPKKLQMVLLDNISQDTEWHCVLEKEPPIRITPGKQWTHSPVKQEGVSTMRINMLRMWVSHSN